MYKYIKGKTITSEERLYTAQEIAEKRYCYFLVDEEILPNGILIAYIIDKYIEKSNYKTYEYYFINIDGVVYRVYQKDLIDSAMKDFDKFISDNQITEFSKECVYLYDTFPFIYYNPMEDLNIVNLSEYRKKKEQTQQEKEKGGTN